MAEALFEEVRSPESPHYAYSVGIVSRAPRRLTTGDSAWADLVAVMEARHRDVIHTTDLGARGALRLGNAATLVQESGAGILIAPGDHRALPDAVPRLHGEPALATEPRENGRPFVPGRLARSAEAREYVRALEGLTPA